MPVVRPEERSDVPSAERIRDQVQKNDSGRSKAVYICDECIELCVRSHEEGLGRKRGGGETGFLRNQTS